MKKYFFTAVFIFTMGFQTTSFAQGMMNWNQNVTAGTQNNAETAADEAAGKAIFTKLQAKQIECKSLKDDDYDLLGDYFMGLMHGENHAAMNESMSRMMGDDGEKQMHITMGKRLSGCDTSAAVPAQFQKFNGMMGMMGWDNNLLHERDFFPGFTFVYFFSIILVWTVLILSIAALSQYLKNSKKK